MADVHQMRHLLHIIKRISPCNTINVIGGEQIMSLQDKMNVNAKPALNSLGSLTVNLKKAAESFEIALFFCQEICFII